MNNIIICTALYYIEFYIKFGSLKKLIYVNSCDHNYKINSRFYKNPQLEN